MKSAQNNQQSISLSAIRRAQDFLATGSTYRLGSLPTESPNPRTLKLSELCQTDLPLACRTFRDVEIDAFQTLLEKEDLATELVEALRKTFEQNRKVFLVGCGATGRLAMVLETIWREEALPGKTEDVVAFTAGGDFALVRSMGIFEDRPELGALHLSNLGFQNGDLLIALTEGGETPFVLGALEQATLLSTVKPWLFFCNPVGLLVQTVERSKRAIQNPRVRAHALAVEPMALTGSTRLQASSVLMAFVGACFREVVTKSKCRWLFTEIIDLLYQLDPEDLIPLIEAECQVHKQNGFTLHRSRSAAIAVLTDTTERAPTFSLAPFESVELDQTASSFINKDSASRTYLEVPNSTSAVDAWRKLILRSPRAFNAPGDLILPDGRPVKVDQNAILSFDFSEGVKTRRQKYGVETELVIDVEVVQELNSSQIIFKTESAAGRWKAEFNTGRDRLVQQSILKYLLNLQSTLAMGCLGRYHGNLMTYVRPTNGKLVDRTLRTLRVLLGQRISQETEQKNNLATDHVQRLKALWESHDDEPLLVAIFTALEQVSVDQPVALRALEILQFDESSHKG
jgi:N-acetylmuramic acid 6-phosphate etherase